MSDEDLSAPHNKYQSLIQRLSHICHISGISKDAARDIKDIGTSTHTFRLDKFGLGSSLIKRQSFTAQMVTATKPCLQF